MWEKRVRCMMGIGKTFAQTLLARELFAPGKDKILHLSSELGLGECDYVVLDFSTSLYKMYHACDTDGTTEHKCLTFLSDYYRAMRIPSTRWVVLVHDGCSFPLKVYARSKRSNSHKTELIKKLYADKRNFLGAFFDFYKGAHPNLITVYGAVPAGCGAPSEDSFEVRVVGQDPEARDRILRTLEDAETQTGDVEADLIQFTVARRLALSDPAARVGVLNVDTDMIAIAIALRNVRMLPPNVVCFFQNKFYGSPHHLTHYMEEYNLKLLLCGGDAVTHDTVPRDDMTPSEHALLLMSDCLDLEQAEKYYGAAWRLLVAHMERQGRRINWEDMGLNAVRVGLRGALIDRCLSNYKDPRVEKLLLKLANGKEALLISNILARLGDVAEAGLELDARNHHTLQMLNRQTAPLGTHGTYLRATERGMMAFYPIASRKAKFSLLLAVLSGTDFSMPLHKFGHHSAFAALADPKLCETLCSAAWSDLRQMRAGVVGQTHPWKFTGRLLCESLMSRANIYPDVRRPEVSAVFDSIAAQARNVVMGWSCFGYFPKLYNALLLNGEAPGYTLEIRDRKVSVSYDVTEEQVRVWKKLLVKRNGNVLDVVPFHRRAKLLRQPHAGGGDSGLA